MTRLFRSKSCGLGLTTTDSLFKSTSPSTPNSLYFTNKHEHEDEEDDYFLHNPITTPFIGQQEERGVDENSSNNNQIPQLLAVVASALRKSLLVTCSVEADDFSSMDIGYPTDTRHVSHVTFDPFHGFLGLPLELQPQLPTKVPSARNSLYILRIGVKLRTSHPPQSCFRAGYSEDNCVFTLVHHILTNVSVFGVSANSMQCSYDQRGNSVPTILLMMQKRLYSGGGLQAEGIFRINAENTKEESVRNQLNKGLVPRGIDVHCLAGLIKAWFRELPTGVLDSLTPEQVMHCNTEDECTQLISRLPPTKAALLDWAINLMADVVQYEHLNKMNARNIAMVFAPNMTQMADPLTALIHAVQVMNLLKTLIIKALRDREDPNATAGLLPSYANSPRSNGEDHISSLNQVAADYAPKEPRNTSILQSSTIGRLECEKEEKLWSFKSKDDKECDYESSPIPGSKSSVPCSKDSLENGCRAGYDDNGEGEGILSRLSITKGVRRLYRHPLFQLNKVVKKSGTLGIVNSRRGDGDSWT